MFGVPGRAEVNQLLADREKHQGDIETVEADRVRAAVGKQYFKTFKVLKWLTFGYYLLSLARDIIFPPQQFASILYFSTGLILALLLAIDFLEQRGIISQKNAHLIPIPVAACMIFNVHCHVMSHGDPVLLIEFIMVMFAFGVVSMLPWVFWTLMVPVCAVYIVAAIMLLGPTRLDVFMLGVGTVMISYGAFTVRFRATWRQIELAVANEMRAEKLADLSKAKDQFIANVSHELRTPLTGLVGMVDLIDESGLSETQRESVSIAKKSADTLRTIINDVLDLSRLDAGQMSLDHAPFDAKGITRKVADIMIGRAQEKGLNLVVEMGDEAIPLLDGDEGRIRQILLNLLGNAIKFTEQGSVTLSVQVLNISEQSVTLRWCVEDTGIGIPEDQLDRLFSRFAQVDASSTRGRSGTGLGLAISKELADLMGSRIEVASRLGEGTRFWLDVNFGTAGAPEVGGTEAPKEMGWIRSEPMTILIAEDNPVNQLLISRILDGEPWQKQIVSNGEKAVACAAETKFDIIFMDIQMPVMDGTAAAQAIRQGDGPNCLTPIYALTANCLPEDQERYKAVGMDGYIGKPIAPAEMDAALAYALQARTAALRSAIAEGEGGS